jgi:hypothetical protein
MKKSTERLEHGKHNEAVCDYLEIRNEFADWIITTAFYSALQFVSYVIFPFEMPAIGGKKTAIHTLDEYFNYRRGGNNKINKHDLLSDLVKIHCNPISEDYDWLLSMSKNARYINYQHDPQVANKARVLMKKVKAHCIK